MDLDGKKVSLHIIPSTAFMCCRPSNLKSAKLFTLSQQFLIFNRAYLRKEKKALLTFVQPQPSCPLPLLRGDNHLNTTALL